MKTLFLSRIIWLSAIILLVNCCAPDISITVCNHCPSASPWAVWNLDLSNPCFMTKSECETWAKGHVPGDQWVCEKCNK